MVTVIGLNVKIDAAVALVGVAVLHNLLHEFFLLDDMSGSMRLDAWRQNIQQLHGCMVAVGIVLCHFHGLELLETCFLGNLVLALVGIMFQVAHIGDVAHIAHLVAQLLQIAEQYIEGDGGTGVSQMRITIDRGSADVHTDHRFVQGNEMFFATRQGVIYEQGMFHIVSDYSCLKMITNASNHF